MGNSILKTLFAILISENDGFNQKRFIKFWLFLCFKFKSSMSNAIAKVSRNYF